MLFRDPVAGTPRHRSLNTKRFVEKVPRLPTSCGADAGLQWTIDRTQADLQRYDDLFGRLHYVSNTPTPNIRPSVARLSLTLSSSLHKGVSAFRVFIDSHASPRTRQRSTLHRKYLYSPCTCPSSMSTPLQSSRLYDITQVSFCIWHTILITLSLSFSQQSQLA